MADIKVEQIISNGIHNVVILKITETSGKTVYCNVTGYNNLYSAQDVARTTVRGF